MRILSLIKKGKLPAAGSIFTWTKTYKLSLAAISRLFTSGAATPSTLILNDEEGPPINFIFETKSFWSLRLYILNLCVTEPAVVNTVSKFKVSALTAKRASVLLMNESFLQEKKIAAIKDAAAMYFIKVIDQK